MGLTEGEGLPRINRDTDPTGIERQDSYAMAEDIGRRNT